MIQRPRAVEIMSVLVIFVGTVVIFGWLYDINILKGSGKSFMVFPAAIAFVFSGITVYFMARVVSGKTRWAEIVMPTTGLTVFLFMATSLISRITDIPTGFEMFFIDYLNDKLDPTKSIPSIMTSINFILIITSAMMFMSFSKKLKKLAMWNGLAITIISSIALLGHVLNIPDMFYYLSGWGSGMAVHTASLFIMLGISISAIANMPIAIQKAITLRTKLVSLFLTSSLIPLTFVGMISYIIGKNTGLIHNEAAAFAIIVSVVACAITIYSLHITWSIIKPLIALRNAANRISAGDYEIDVKIDGTVEMNDLTLDVNRMAKKLAQDQKDLIKSERLAAIGELSARIAHDLRNPLSIIKNGFEVIKIKDSIFTNETRQIMPRIEMAVGRMTHQINEVLDYVTPKPLNYKSIKISEIIQSCLDRMQIPSTILIQHTQDDLELVCDVEKMEIVLINLITNAIQSMNEVGEIRIECIDQKDAITIMVSDNGPGIADKVLPRIFDPLFTTRQIGTGLGLPSCKSIIERHGGTIDVETEVGQYTKFIIKLPKKLAFGSK